jgi:hypothetical protein
MTKQRQEQVREGEYFLSLEEALILAKKATWAEWKPQPDNFRIGGFYGEAGGASVNLLRDKIQISSEVSSEFGIHGYKKDLLLADYQDPRFEEIYRGLLERDSKSFDSRKANLVRKLKSLARNAETEK